MNQQPDDKENAEIQRTVSQSELIEPLGVKVYCMNWDGKNERMVAAKTKKAAIAALGTTPYQFNQYASETGNHDDIKTAISDIGSVFSKSYKRGGAWEKINP